MNHGWLHTIQKGPYAEEDLWDSIDVVVGNGAPSMFLTAGRSKTVQGPSEIPTQWELESWTPND